MSEQNSKILLLGLGQVGSRLLDFMACSGLPADYTVAVRSPTKYLERVNLSRVLAAQFKKYPNVNVRRLDMSNIESLAEMLVQIKPDVVISAVTLQSWWVVTQLPEPYRSLVAQSEVGPWVPCHLALIRKLMLAVQQSGIKTKVINCSYPDVVNPALAGEKLEPLVGIGNVANPVPSLELAAAEHLMVSPDRIEIRLIGHHYTSFYLRRGLNLDRIPFLLRVFKDAEDVTMRISLKKIFELVTGKYQRLGGLEGQSITASSAFRVLAALLSDTPIGIHAPGPKGLPGGYPILLSRDSLDLNLPVGVTREDAISINSQGGQMDGIMDVEPDGTIIFAPAQMEIMTRLFGYKCEKLHPSDADAWASELIDRYEVFLKSIGRTPDGS